MKYFALILLFFSLTACGEKEVAKEPPIVKIEVQSFPDDSTEGKSFTIDCETEKEFCSALAESDVLKAHDMNVACTEQYGGPQQLNLIVTQNNVDTFHAYRRNDGCDIARYDAVVKLLKTLKNYKFKDYSWDPAV